MSERTRFAAAALVVVVAAGCGAGRGEPDRFTGKVRSLSAASSEVRACLALLHVDDQPLRSAVERIGRWGRSVTFRLGARVLGCDQAPASRPGWCAGAVGLMRDGALVDPRLNASCRDSNGRPIAFGWIEPVREAASIAVLGAGGPELYPAAGRVPVRVTTTRVSFDAAAVDVAQFAADGRVLERRRMVLRVAG